MIRFMLRYIAWMIRRELDQPSNLYDWLGDGVYEAEIKSWRERWRAVRPRWEK